MTFRDRYMAVKAKALKEPQDFIKKTAKATGVTEATVRQWITGSVRPNQFVRKQIEQLFNAPFEELFPTINQ